MTGVALGVGLLLALIAAMMFAGYALGVIGDKATERWEPPDWLDMWPLAVLAAVIVAVLLLKP